MTTLFGQVNAEGYARGETPESFRRVSLETLQFVADNARSAARRKLATDEIERRARNS